MFGCLGASTWNGTNFRHLESPLVDVGESQRFDLRILLY